MKKELIAKVYQLDRLEDANDEETIKGLPFLEQLQLTSVGDWKSLYDKYEGEAYNIYHNDELIIGGVIDYDDRDIVVDFFGEDDEPKVGSSIREFLASEDNKARKEYETYRKVEAQYIAEDIYSAMEEYPNLVFLNENLREIADLLVESARHSLSKNDAWFEAYWMSINQTIEQANEKMQRSIYEEYKKDWCKARGYDLEEMDEELGINGEGYVCYEEFITNDDITMYMAKKKEISKNE